MTQTQADKICCLGPSLCLGGAGRRQRPLQAASRTVRFWSCACCHHALLLPRGCPAASSLGTAGWSSHPSVLGGGVVLWAEGERMHWGESGKPSASLCPWGARPSVQARRPVTEPRSLAPSAHTRGHARTPSRREAWESTRRLPFLVRPPPPPATACLSPGPRDCALS